MLQEDTETPPTLLKKLLDNKMSDIMVSIAITVGVLTLLTAFVALLGLLHRQTNLTVVLIAGGTGIAVFCFIAACILDEMGH